MTCHLNFFKYSFLRAFVFVWYWQWNEIGYRNWERDTFKICLVVFCFNRQVGLVDFSFCFGKEIMSHVLDPKFISPKSREYWNIFVLCSLQCFHILCWKGKHWEYLKLFIQRVASWNILRAIYYIHFEY